MTSWCSFFYEKLLRFGQWISSSGTFAVHDCIQYHYLNSVATNISCCIFRLATLTIYVLSFSGHSRKIFVVSSTCYISNQNLMQVDLSILWSNSTKIFFSFKATLLHPEELVTIGKTTASAGYDNQIGSFLVWSCVSYQSYIWVYRIWQWNFSPSCLPFRRKLWKFKKIKIFLSRKRQVE